MLISVIYFIYLFIVNNSVSHIFNDYFFIYYSLLQGKLITWVTQVEFTCHVQVNLNYFFYDINLCFSKPRKLIKIQIIKSGWNWNRSVIIFFQLNKLTWLIFDNDHWTDSVTFKLSFCHIKCWVSATAATLLLQWIWCCNLKSKINQHLLVAMPFVVDTNDN